MGSIEESSFSAPAETISVNGLLFDFDGRANNLTLSCSSLTTGRYLGRQHSGNCQALASIRQRTGRRSGRDSSRLTRETFDRHFEAV
jgi:hypothetical protein